MENNKGKVYSLGMYICMQFEPILIQLIVWQFQHTINETVIWITSN